LNTEITIKEFRNLNEQVDILLGRGLVIKNIDRTKNYLLSNNYYNIINGYSVYFKENGQENYIEGTTFDEITHLYFFENELKRTVFNAILTAEKHLKSIFSHRFSELYNNKRYSYLDVNCYDQNKILQVVSTINRLSKIVNDNKRYENNAIYHYVKKYNDVPIWVLVDFMDFGTLKRLIELSSPPLKGNITNDINSFLNDNIPDIGSRINSKTMISFIKNIHEIRNVCAHNNRLLDFSCKSDSLLFSPLHSRYNIGQHNRRRQLYSTVLSLQCFLSKTEYAVLHNTIIKRIKYLNNNLHTISSEKILMSLGFPDDFELETIKQN
jgi:abortive infection bacteriophage resistance protein